MDNLEDIEDLSPKDIKQLKIPDSLKEIREIPDGYVPVYFYEDKSRLDRLGTFGFQPELNYMDEAKPEIEKIFDESRREYGITVDRGECLFAFPQHPDRLQGEFKFDPEERVMLEAWVDPNTVLVTEGEYYTEASWDLGDGNPESAKSWADTYWESAIPLYQYLEDPEAQSFVMVEALVPGPIPTDHMRVVENPKGNGEYR